MGISPGGSDGKESACNAGDWVPSLGEEDALEKGMATRSSTLAWRSPQTEKPGRQQPMGSKESYVTERLTLSLSKEHWSLKWVGGGSAPSIQKI